MSTTKRFSSILVLLLLASFISVGCGLLPSSEEQAETTPEGYPADPNVGGGIQTGGEVTSETEPPSDAVAPEEAPPVEENTSEGEAPVTEDEVAVDEVTETEEESPEMEESETAVSEESTEAETDEADDMDTEESEPADTNTTTDTPSNTSPVPPPSGNCPVTHTVQAGENLYRIGLQYGMSWVPIANANGLANPNAIYVGQVLVIPVEGCAPVTPTPVPPIEGTTYVVQYGDTLYSIGLKFGVSWVQIAEANGIVNPNQIYAGQVLKIPAAQPGPTPNFTHLVQPGETLFSISIHYGVPWQAIADVNQIPPPYIIYAGQTIIIPGSW